MSNMPTKEEVAQYKQLKAEGKYREAAKVLLPYKDNEKIRTLITQLKEAHEASQGVVPVKKSANWGRRILFLVLGIVGICGAIYAGYQVWYELSGQKEYDVAWYSGIVMCIYLEIYEDYAEGICDADKLMERHGDIMLYCTLGYEFDDAFDRRSTTYRCLEQEGVDLIAEATEEASAGG